MNRTNVSGSLDAYLKKIGEYPLLSQEEEVALAARIQKGEEEALQQLMNSNRRFVVSVALPYQKRGATMEELIKAGNEGLEKAARNFSVEKDCKFIAYAVWFIKQSIEDYIGPEE